MYKPQLPEELQDLSGEKLKIAMIKYRKKEIVKLVCRQTNYTTVESEKLLEENNYNYLQVIKLYINPDIKKKEKNPSSLNQQIIGEIRNFMDQGAKLTEQRRKKMAYLEFLKKKQKMQNTKIKDPKKS